MPWFITSIYSKDITNKRTFGFFDTYAKSTDAIRRNVCDMHECLYDYLVLEYIEEGIHPEARFTYWFIWLEYKDGWNNNRWEYIPPDKVPENMKQFTNWAIG